MKLKLNETLEQSLDKLIHRTKQPSFDNNKGLTKIQQNILLDSIDFLKILLEEDKSLKKSKGKPSSTQVSNKKTR
jgi:hypothetical protein